MEYNIITFKLIIYFYLIIYNLVYNYILLWGMSDSNTQSSVCRTVALPVGPIPLYKV